MISVRRLLAMTWARSLEFLRDRSALAWNLMFPVLMVVAFAVIFSGPGQPLFKVAVLAQAPLDEALHPFLGLPHLHAYHEESLEDAMAKVARHRVDLLLDLREEPGRYWINEESPKGQALELMLRGTGGPALDREAVRGAAIRYVDWVAPGLLGVNMMFSCLFGIGYVIVRYRKSGYLKRLNATPLTAFEFITAQLLSRLLLIVAITVAMYVAMDLILDFRMEGSYLALLLVTVMGAFALIAMGLVISARISSEELAGGMLNLLSWPMMILSGVFFSLDGAPRAVQWAAEVFPLTHILDAARAIMLDGAGLPQVVGHLAVLAAMALLFLLVGAGGFRWTQD